MTNSRTYPEWRNTWSESPESRHDPLTQAFIDREERARYGGKLLHEVLREEHEELLAEYEKAKKNPKDFIDQNDDFTTPEIIEEQYKKMIEESEKSIESAEKGWDTADRIELLYGKNWVDHVYTEVDGQGNAVWTSHPYWIRTEDFDDFLYLEQQGFKVTITGCREWEGYGHGAARIIIEPPPGVKVPLPEGCDKEAVYLYRHYDEHGNLLYTGISIDPSRRFKQHRHKSVWWDRIATTTYEKYPNRKAAEKAEKAAIKKEHPQWNIIHNAS